MARTMAFAVVMMGFTSSVIAAVLPISGAYGDEAGCHFFLKGEPAEGMVLLTGDTFASPAGGCDFVNLVSAEGGEMVAEAACDGIGKIHEGLDRVTVRDDAAGYFVMIEKAEVAGPLAPCPGAEAALSPGVRI